MAATITPGYAYSSTGQVTNTNLAQLVGSATISNIDQTNMVSGTGLVITSTTAPSNVNAIWFDSSATLTPKYWNGSAWVVLVASVPSNYRTGMYCMQASTTTITVSPGNVEINGSSVSTTSNTTLTITTAGNWAGGSSLQATNTLGFIMLDIAGNFKLTTTPPAYADYGLNISAANNTKRYASVSSTTYRYIGWFYMNATGSGQLDTFGVSNLADGGIKNVVEFETGAVATGSTTIPDDDTIPQNTEGDQYMSQVFRPTNVNNKLKIDVVFFGDNSGGQINIAVPIFQDSNASAIATGACVGLGSRWISATYSHYMKAGTISLTTFKVRAGGSSGTMTFNGIASGRKYGGVVASSIRIEEIESQLT